MIRFLESPFFAAMFRVATWLILPMLCWAMWALLDLKGQVVELRSEADRCALVSATPPATPTLRN